MAKHRSALLLAGEDVTTAGTKVIDIDVEKPISHIDIKWKVTKAQDNMDAGGPADLPKIEIVDGAKVLWSANGYLAQALGYYNRPGRQLDSGQVLGALSQENHFPIDFGRHLWDPLLAFDPKRYTNPQLRITHNESLSDTSATENELEVTADIFDEKVISPMGFLSAILHYDYTCGGNDSYEMVALPDDRIIRQLLLRAFTTDHEPWYTIDEARLDENTLGNIVFDHTSLENYFTMMRAKWEPLVFPYVLRANDDGEVYYLPATDYWANLVATPRGSATALQCSVDEGYGGKHTLYGSIVGIEANCIMSGYLPWHTFQFPFGIPTDMEDWYDPREKKPRLRLRTGATGGIGQILLEELVPY